MAILSTILSISLIATLLAVIISVADKFLNNYGDYTIDINGGSKKLTVKGGDTLLSSLATNKIFIPSACGGKATCGLCKVRINEGAGELLPTEEPYLNGEERKEGVRISCQVKVKNNLSIVIPEEFFNIREYVTTVEKITDLTYDIKEFKLRLKGSDEINFKAGQYVQIRTKPYAKVTQSVSRAYSISSRTSEKNIVELIIRLVPGGICTTYMHEHIRPGDEVVISGPYGDFYLRDDPDEYIFIAGGSGLAPIKSMIYDILEKGIDKPMTFFFGAGARKDLYYYELFSGLEKEIEKFKYIPALSSPLQQDNWEGETGLITEIVAKYVEDEKNKHAYLCGSPGMLDACMKVLNNKGFTPEIIFFDKF